MISTYIHRSRNTLSRWARDPQLHSFARGAAHAMAGFCLSAASLEQGMLPLVMGLVWACRGWRAVLVAAGGLVGYGVFWGAGGLQGLIWTGLALAGVLLLADRRISRELPLLIPATGMLMVSAVGLGFQLWAGDTTSIPLYLIRVALGGAAPWLFSLWLRKREPVLEWVCWGLFSLGLAQIAPVRWLGLGFVAAGVCAVGSVLPCAAITGLALDMAGITPVPMTAVAVLSFLPRLLPHYSRRAGSLIPVSMGILVMYVCGRWDLLILPGLLLGGVLGAFFTPSPAAVPRRGETGVAQVRLEMAAGVLDRVRKILTDVPERFVDEGALVQRAVSEACAGCSARDRCRDSRKMAQLPEDLLRRPLLTVEEIPVRCKKASRVLEALHRSQAQLRTIQADRLRQREYREAVVQQYTFLEDFLRSLSDALSQRRANPVPVYTPLISVYGNRKSADNGDRYLEFAGVQNTYYILLCDGMGTGTGAVQEGKCAADILHRLLCCGFPAKYALRSLNSLCALRDRAASVTVDLAQVQLDTGKVTIYKWGGAASYLIGTGGAERLGSASAPPGLSVTDDRSTTCSFTLKRGQSLLLVSDGLEEEAVWQHCREADPMSVATLAQTLLRECAQEDDATLVTLQLIYAKP